MGKNIEAPVVEQTAVLEKVGAVTRVYLGVAVGLGLVASSMAAVMIPVRWYDDDSSQSQGISLKIAQVVNIKSIMNQDDQFVQMKYYGGSNLMYTQTDPIMQDSGQVAKKTSNQVLKIQTGTGSPININGGGATTFSIGGNTNSGGGATSFSIESVGGTTPRPVSFLNSALGINPVKAATTFSIESVAPSNTNSGGGATSFSIESVGGATSFSIEPYPQVGTPAQMAVMEYRLVTDKITAPTRKLTICIGRTSVTSLYVGTDGSTYANSSFGVLNGRTTNESCANIKNRAMKMNQISGGTITQQAGDYEVGEYVFLRAYIYLARFSNGQFVPSDPTNVTSVNIQTEAPLYAGFGSTSNGLTSKPSAPAIITLSEQKTGAAPITHTVCFPETWMSPTTGGPVYYFDTTGTPFYDIFLQNRAMASNCSDITAKALKMTNVDTGTLVNESSVYSGVNIQRSNHMLGRFIAGNFDRTNSTPAYGGGDPLVISPDRINDLPNTSITYPRSIVTLTGTYLANYDTNSNVLPTPVSATLCYPETTWTSGTSDARSWYFYDKDGNPYTDIFLQTPAMTTKCGDITAKALKMTNVDTGTLVNESSVYSGVNIQRSNHMLGRFIAGNFDRTNSTPAYGGGDPLVISPDRINDLPNTSITYPRSIVTLTGTYLANYDINSNVLPTPVSATLCYPETTWTSGTSDARSWYFYDKDGNPYTDIFLTQPKNCGGYKNITIISTSSTTATIGWETPRTTCSRINYGTVVNALNSGPVAETAPCTGTSHQAKITGLTANTKYLYEIVGLDGVKDVVSGQQTFTTSEAVATYSNIRIISSAATTVTIGWDTDLPTCGRINYGKVSGQLNSGPVSDSCYNTTKAPFTTGHQVTITGLTASTKYLYEIVSTNKAVSGEQTFTTATASAGGGTGREILLDEALPEAN